MRQNGILIDFFIKQLTIICVDRIFFSLRSQCPRYRNALMQAGRIKMSVHNSKKKWPEDVTPKTNFAVARPVSVFVSLNIIMR